MSTTNAKGLLFVYGECGSDATEEEFNDWYDNEHAPARLTVAGFHNALRYKAIDSLQPTWLALYDLSSPEVISSDGYKSLGARASKREPELVKRLQTLDRRVYTQIAARTHPTASPSTLPGKVLSVVIVELTPDGEAEYNKWYDEEHMDLLSKVPGWLRGRRYKFVSRTELGGKADKAKPVPAVTYLAIHEWDRSDYRELPELKHAISTPWTERVKKTMVKMDYRLFELYKDFGPPQTQ